MNAYPVVFSLWCAANAKRLRHASICKIAPDAAPNPATRARSTGAQYGRAAAKALE